MAAVATMPGNWPLRDEADTEIEMVYPRFEIQTGRSSLQVPTSPSMISSSSSRSSADELSFDTMTPNGTIDGNEESSMPLYLIFEPVVESVLSQETVDWRRYVPPAELLRAQEGTSEQIRRLLEPPIERIRARHAEEDARRVAQARRKRPLHRSGRAPIKPPKREPLMTGALHPLDVPGDANVRGSRLSTGSASSVLTSDSGYVSQVASSPELSLTEGHNPSPSRRGKGRAFGFSAIFGRKNKPSFNFGTLNTEQESRPTSSTGGDIPIIVPTTEITPATTTECVSCLDDFDSSKTMNLACHSYCNACFILLITTALESETHWPAKCCLNPIPRQNILPHIPSTLKSKYAQREAEWSIPAGDRIYCAINTCSTWIPPKNINTLTHAARCPSCSKQACTICRGAYHNGSDCPNDPVLLATINLAELEGWKRCYQCHALVEHNKGCRHMTCRCKAQFCYICSARWRTCQCTDAQLNEIQTRAETHRTQQAAQTAREMRERARREAEAEEERIAIQMVAEFVAAEAERERVAEEARRAREEEERRIREEEQRRRVEEHVAATNVRFRVLTRELNNLHDVQKVWMAERYEFETERLRQALRDELEVLAIRHPTEISALTASSIVLVHAAEQKYVDEYLLRLAEEKRIEESYMVDLRAFYNQDPEAEFKIRDARDELRTTQSREYKFWDDWRRKQLTALKEGEGRKLEALRIKQDKEKSAIEGRAKIDEVEWKRRVQAGGKWVEVIVSERVSMLESMEREEYASEP